MPILHRLLASMKLGFILARYMGSSLITAAVDYLVFLVAYPLLKDILLGVFLARLAAVAVNFVLLRLAVFHSSDRIWATFPKYILVVIISGGITSALISFFNRQFNIPVVVGKMMAEGLLYFINFAILNGLVFRRHTREDVHSN